MTPLFNEYEGLSHEGQGIADMFRAKTKEFMKDFDTKSVSLRELEAVLTNEISVLLAEMRLTRALERKRNERSRS